MRCSSLKTKSICKIIKVVSYQAVLVGDVVGQLKLVKGHNFLHPLLAGRRAVRVDVHSLGHLRVGLPGHDPPAASKNEEDY